MVYPLNRYPFGFHLRIVPLNCSVGTRPAGLQPAPEESRSLRKKYPSFRNCSRCSSVICIFFLERELSFCQRNPLVFLNRCQHYVPPSFTGRPVSEVSNSRHPALFSWRITYDLIHQSLAKVKSSCNRGPIIICAKASLIPPPYRRAQSECIPSTISRSFARKRPSISRTSEPAVAHTSSSRPITQYQADQFSQQSLLKAHCRRS